MNRVMLWGAVLCVVPSYSLADNLQIEEIKVWGRTAHVIGHALTASEGTVSQKDLAIRPLLRAGEILEAVPGLVATQHSGSGKANQYFLRGFNLDHGTDFATSIDGVPINMRTHGHGQGYTDLNFIIPELVGGIHYKKGPYYADVGDFSGAGSANIMTSMALPDNPAKKHFSLGIGEEDFYRLLVTGEVAIFSGDLIYGAEHQTYQGPWDSINEDVNKTNIWLKQQWADEHSAFDLMLMVYDNTWNSADQIPQRAVTQGIISELGSIDITSGGESSRHSLSGRFRHKHDLDNLFQAQMYIIDYDMSLWSNFSYFTDPDGDQFQQIDHRKIFGGDFSWAHTRQLFERDMLNTFGLQTRVDDISEVGLRRSQQRQMRNTIRTDAVEELSGSIYWQNQFSLSTSLRSVLGIRYDYFTFEVNPITAANADSLSPNGGNVDDAIVTTSLSLIYTLTDQQEIYTSAGEGFHSNDARGITIQIDPVSAQPLDPADPLVNTFGYEMGWRGNFEDVTASIAIWQLKIDSELLFVGDEGITEDTGINSTRKGLELTSYYRINHNWMFDLEYAYSHARFDQLLEGTKSIPGALEQVVTTGMHWQMNDHFFSHLRVRHLAAYPLDGGTMANASTLVNLRMGYQASSSVKLTLDILNLLDSTDRDVEYYYASQLPGESAPVDDHHYHVFEPRSARLYIEWEF